MLKGEPWTAVTKAEAYEELLRLAQDQKAEIGPDPNVRNDLLGIRKVLTRNGVTYELRKTPDGRHSDHAPSIAMALTKAIFPPKIGPKPPSEMTPGERAAAEKAAFLDKLSRDKRRENRFGRLPATHRRPR